MLPKREKRPQLPLPSCLGSLALGIAVLPEIPPFEHDMQQLGRSTHIHIHKRQFGAMQPEVLRQEGVKLHAPFHQARPLVHGFQLFRSIATL